MLEPLLFPPGVVYEGLPRAALSSLWQPYLALFQLSLSRRATKPNRSPFYMSGGDRLWPSGEIGKRARALGGLVGNPFLDHERGTSMSATSGIGTKQVKCPNGFCGRKDVRPQRAPKWHELDIMISGKVHRHQGKESFVKNRTPHNKATLYNKAALAGSALGVAMAIAVSLAGCADSSKVATTTELPISADSVNSADPGDSGPAATVRQESVGSTATGPRDGLAESKADLASCTAKHQHDLDAAPANAKKLLKEHIFGRCSHENNLKQIQAIEARQQSASTQRSTRPRGDRDATPVTGVADIARKSQEEIRKHSDAIEYLKRGELPESYMEGNGQAKTAAERRAALIAYKSTQKRHSDYTAEYSDCMSRRGFSIASTFDYDIIYVKHGHERSKTELAKVRKADTACRAEAESLYPGGPPP